VSMSIGKWSELSAEHEAKYNGDETFLVLTMSKTSGVSEGFYGLVVGVSGLTSDRSSRRHNHVGVTPRSCSVAISNPRSWHTGHRSSRPANRAETRGHVRSDEWAGGRKVSRKDFHRFAGQYDLNGSRVHVGQAPNGH
jgi:hypothetical protein